MPVFRSNRRISRRTIGKNERRTCCRHVTSLQVRDVRGVIEREEAALGVFLTLEPATAPMRKEAAEAHVWQTKGLAGSKHPRLQILTIEDLLAGKKIDMPAQQEIRSFKQAPKAKGKKTDEAKL